jgi:hypothetical protein
VVLINQHFLIQVGYFGAITVVISDEVEVISYNSLRSCCVCLCSTGM